MKTKINQKTKKSALRNELRARRRQLNESDRLSLDASINHFLAKYIAEQRPATIAAFWPFDGEPNLLPTLAATDQLGTQIALPVIRQSPTGPSLIFAQWTAATDMKKNRYGIPEPYRSPEILLFNIDLLLLPLVGWDESGSRLGMGAGFYDRALAPLNQSEVPIRTGVAYQLQKVPEVPAEPWDIRLHMLLSETGWFTCPSR
ncbi:MAG: 5-formyltetrahydrofolate cyclo-ligase [Proteobacteria bacterium]|nr:5-formyltetrahydrofolate cyclo-ligase [Pseudomonadota bacterium]